MEYEQDTAIVYFLVIQLKTYHREGKQGYLAYERI